MQIIRKYFTSILSQKCKETLNENATLFHANEYNFEIRYSLRYFHKFFASSNKEKSVEFASLEEIHYLVYLTINFGEMIKNINS